MTNRVRDPSKILLQAFSNNIEGITALSRCQEFVRLSPSALRSANVGVVAVQCDQGIFSTTVPVT